MSTPRDRRTASTGQSAPAHERRLTRRSAAEKLRALIVDDEAPARARLRRMLRGTGRGRGRRRGGHGSRGARALRRARPGRRAARRAHAGHGRHRGRPAPGRARRTAGGDFHDGLRRIRARGVRDPGGRLPGEAGAPRKTRARHTACCARRGTAVDPARRPVTARQTALADLRAARRASSSSFRSRTSCTLLRTRNT